MCQDAVFLVSRLVFKGRQFRNLVVSALSMSLTMSLKLKKKPGTVRAPPSKYYEQATSLFVDLKGMQDSLAARSIESFERLLEVLRNLVKTLQDFETSFQGNRQAVRKDEELWFSLGSSENAALLLQVLNLSEEDAVYLSDDPVYRKDIHCLVGRVKANALDCCSVIVENAFSHAPLDSPKTAAIKQAFFDAGLFTAIKLTLDEALSVYPLLLEEEAASKARADLTHALDLEQAARTDPLAKPCLTTRLGVVRWLVVSLCECVQRLGTNIHEVKTFARKSGFLKPLCDVLQLHDPQTLRFGAQVIRTLAFNDRDKVVKDELVAHDCIAPLILLMRSANEDDQCIAVGAIGNLVHSCNAIKQRVLEHGGLQPVIALLKGKNPESRKEAALLVGQFANVTNTLVANDDTWKVKIAQRAAIPPLVTSSNPAAFQRVEYAAFALGRIAHTADNRAGLVEAGAVRPLVTLIRSSVPNLQHNATFAIYSLADAEDNVPALLREGVVLALLGTHFEHPQARDCADKTIVRLHEKFRADGGKLKNDMNFYMKNYSGAVRQQMARDLVHVLPDLFLHEVFIRHGALATLFRALGDDWENAKLGVVNKLTVRELVVAFRSLLKKAHAIILRFQPLPTLPSTPNSMNQTVPPLALPPIANGGGGGRDPGDDLAAMPEGREDGEEEEEGDGDDNNNNGGEGAEDGHGDEIDGEDEGIWDARQGPQALAMVRARMALQFVGRQRGPAAAAAGGTPRVGLKRDREGEPKQPTPSALDLGMMEDEGLDLTAEGVRSPGAMGDEGEAGPSGKGTEPSLRRSAANLVFVNRADGSDVRFLVEGRTCFAHRALLSASSDYFRAMFTGPFADAALKVVDIALPEHIRFAALEAVLRFVYTGQAAVSLDEAQQVLELANMYLLTELNAACGDRLAEGLSYETLRDLCDLARAFHCSTLAEHCAAYAVLHGEEIIENWDLLSNRAEAGDENNSSAAVFMETGEGMDSEEGEEVTGRDTSARPGQRPSKPGKASTAKKTAGPGVGAGPGSGPTNVAAVALASAMGTVAKKLKLGEEGTPHRSPAADFTPNTAALQFVKRTTAEEQFRVLLRSMAADLYTVLAESIAYAESLLQQAPELDRNQAMKLPDVENVRRVVQGHTYQSKNHEQAEAIRQHQANQNAMLQVLAQHHPVGGPGPRAEGALPPRVLQRALAVVAMERQGVAPNRIGGGDEALRDEADVLGGRPRRRPRQEAAGEP